MAAPVMACIGLGGNVGDAVGTVAAALRMLDALPGLRVVRASRLYRTPAWGLREQPAFVNAVALVETSLSPRQLLDALLRVELDFGRTRAPDGSDRWGPRILDLDVLLYGAREVDEPGLRIPHPRLHERAFALVPLVEAAPDAIIPGAGAARDVLASLETEGIEALG